MRPLLALGTAPVLEVEVGGSMGWRLDVAQVAKSPKSTVVGLCVLALAAERGIHFDEAGRLAMSARDWFDVGCGALTAIVSGFSSDAKERS